MTAQCRHTPPNNDIGAYLLICAVAAIQFYIASATDFKSRPISYVPISSTEFSERSKEPGARRRQSISSKSGHSKQQHDRCATTRKSPVGRSKEKKSRKAAFYRSWNNNIMWEAVRSSRCGDRRGERSYQQKERKNAERPHIEQTVDLSVIYYAFGKAHQPSQNEQRRLVSKKK